MRVALAQISSTRDVSRNIELVRQRVAQAVEYEADLVVFPEAAMLSFDGALPELTQQWHLKWEEALREIAREYGVAVAAGGFAPAGERVRNQLCFVTPEGEESVYTKIHLFDAFGFAESDTVEAGEELVTGNCKGITVGLSVCYDVRFPKLFAEYSRQGAQVQIVSASWGAGETKVEQWRALTTARALDSNSFVVAVGQSHPITADQEFDPESKAPLGVGRSRVIDPFGRELVELGESPALRLVELDLDAVEKAKEELPVLENAKLGY
ncbi:carbon-nitrogen hydrolase family protein [Rothia sp. ZJ932]|nr:MULTISPECIES: carbon-nitrogen hydrolase family protein [unclassified Rothia (in: high G+C Gram-positive bacteria)]MBM7051549.1 carbon-nitrogen hydrolase family protein [Rothia sp. ZJ1223]QRZ62507.1 carbon-nitrogen hydrolase family protein [Rothia sp. ZJ932]